MSKPESGASRLRLVVARIPFVGMLAAALAAGAPPARTHLENYALILQDEPVVKQIRSRAELRSTAAQRHLQTISGAQSRLKIELARRHIAMTGSVQLLLNAIFVRISGERVDELRALPGVKAVAPLPRIHRHMDQAVQLMGIPDAWNAVGGVGSAGAGVKIGILDTGIDQTHAAFQDPNLSAPDGFPLGDPNFTNGKVIVARSYVSALAQAYDTTDDLSPRDHSGHGTAVAMIAAGAQNQGPLAIITGIAPKAWLGSYKVFGTPGVNDDAGPAIPLALDDAFRDGMDVVLLPFGGEPIFPALAQDCSPAPCDTYYFPIEQAVKNAMAHMTVVVSAGNDGNLGVVIPTLNTINTPGVVPDVITVGATSNAHIFFSTLQVAGMANINALFGSDEPASAAAVTAPLQDVSQIGNDGFACTPLAAGLLSGAIALIQRGNCSYDVKVNNAQAAGAVGAIIAQSAGNDMPVPMQGMMGTGIPSAMIGYSDSRMLANFLGTTVTLDPTLQSQPVSSGNVMFYSSRGPTHGHSLAGLALKPDLVAVGDRIYTATQSSDPGGDLYNPSGYTAVGGSSFAAAIVTGAAALVKQMNPGFTPLQIKSALVNTATQDVTDGSDTARVTAVGAGRLNAAAAVSVGATVTPATLSFGAVGAVPVSLTLTIANTSSASTTFTLAVAPRDTDNNAQINVVPNSFTLNPGDSRQVAAQLTGRTPAPGSYEGFVTIGTGTTTVNVPYLYLVGDGRPFNITAIRQGNFVSVVNDPLFWLLGFKLTDRYGVPVTNYPVFFHVVKGAGVIAPDPANKYAADANTDKTGVAAAWIRFGAPAGDQIFNATAGGLTVEFDGYAIPAPVINSVVDAATGQAPTPGSVATISGSSLSNAGKQLSFGPPVVQLGGVSVSFSAPGISVPGLLSSVSSGQITVQIPAGLAGRSSATMTVIKAGVWSDPYTVRLATQ